ncbi:MAG: amidohydrolase [Victivallales bacterium]|nr:amidohydrolase [Victivallales bacterium]
MKKELLLKAEETVDNILDDLIELRHSLHKIPEIGYKEFRTSKKIRKKLKEYNIFPQQPYLETDIVCILNPEKTGRNITIRADIDAIPQTELNNFSYKSQTKGMMHACGHDGHAAILLGTAVVLNELKDKLPGSLRILFQPAEECLRGAYKLIDTGVFDKNPPTAVIGLHNLPTYTEGVFYGKAGILTSSVTFFKINIAGKSIHSSTPEKGVDPLITGAQIVNEFDNIINTPDHILHNANLKVCSFYSGTGRNIIPPNALLQGNARCFETEQEKAIPDVLEKTVSEICKKYGAEYELTVEPPMSIVHNDKRLLEYAEKNVIELFGREYWTELQEPYKFSEDFSAYEKLAPTLFLGLGTGIDRPELHTQTFDFNDKIIKKAVMLWVGMVIDLLS